jgi:ribosome-binding ATPase YchF (GTP1/OBG family)
LVPGAYKGRGKGNRFLSDLCDADVLIHVVDVTGRADRDGNIVAEDDCDATLDSLPAAKVDSSSVVPRADNKNTASGVRDAVIGVESEGGSGSDRGSSGGSTPTEDAKWIREELHRWIHGKLPPISDNF